MSPEENKPQGNIDWLEKYDLALEDRVACDTVECRNDAEYFARVECCSAVLIQCKTCMHDSYKTIIKMIENGKNLMCKGCGKANRPQGWLKRPEKLSLLDS